LKRLANSVLPSSRAGRRKKTSDVDTAANTSEARLLSNRASLPEGFTPDLPSEVLASFFARVTRIENRSTGGESAGAPSAASVRSKKLGSPLYFQVLLLA
jgi:hypothetical protein